MFDSGIRNEETWRRLKIEREGIQDKALRAMHEIKQVREKQDIIVNIILKRPRSNV
jgi:hypothetical protein